MLAYLLDGVGPVQADNDPRMRRLLRSGPWQYQPSANGGTIAAWKIGDGGPRPLASYGAPRPTADGLMFYPPKELPTPDQLLKPNVSGRADVHRVTVDTGVDLVVLSILPAYSAPRRILENNTLGVPVAAYALKARALSGRFSENPKIRIDEIIDDLTEVCRLAIEHTTRCTPELIAECGWMTEDSIWDIWEGVVRVPKDLRKSVSEPSEPSSPVVP